jgi:hypothetical protein
MSDYTTTPNLGLFKPTPNADGDMWGDHWNQNADKLDAAVGGAFLPLSGGTVTGPTTFTAAVTLANLPTSNAGLQHGTLWNNGGFICVV